jgi:hypothetical protein
MAKQHLKAAAFNLKELLVKPMKYYHGIILLGILVAIYIK